MVDTTTSPAAAAELRRSARIRRITPSDACEPIVADDGFSLRCARHPFDQSPFWRAEGCTLESAVLCIACGVRPKALRRHVVLGLSTPCAECMRILQELQAHALVLPGAFDRCAQRPAGPTQPEHGPRRVSDLFAEVVTRGAEPFVLNAVAVREVVTLRWRPEGEVPQPRLGGTQLSPLDPRTVYVTLSDWSRLVPRDPAAVAGRLRACLLRQPWKVESVVVAEMPEAWFVDVVGSLLEFTPSEG